MSCRLHPECHITACQARITPQQACRRRNCPCCLHENGYRQQLVLGGRHATFRCHLVCPAAWGAPSSCWLAGGAGRAGCAQSMSRVGSTRAAAARDRDAAADSSKCCARLDCLWGCAGAERVCCGLLGTGQLDALGIASHIRSRPFHTHVTRDALCCRCCGGAAQPAVSQVMGVVVAGCCLPRGAITTFTLVVPHSACRHSACGALLARAVERNAHRCVAPWHPAQQERAAVPRSSTS
jgi:hypothetical protein